jgi:uracil-DNA glycosylase family 4
MLMDIAAMGGDLDRIGAAEAASALAWWLDAGVDMAVQEAPRDWLEGETAPPSAASQSAPLADAPLPETLDLFRDWLSTTPSLPQARSAAGRVLPRGAENAPVMLVADAPAAEDAASGQPIAGKAWELMQNMLRAVGIAPDEAYAANISCFHAPGQRMGSGEMEACAAIARRHIALARPKLLLLLGDGPARALLGKPLAAARGHVQKVEGVRTVATFHPRFLLGEGGRKALAWQDLLLLTEESS